MRYLFAFVSAVAILFLDSLPLEAQPPGKELPETRIVLRVSRKFIQRLTGSRFQRDVPIDSNVDGMRVTGKATVTGKFKVTLVESDTDTDFDVVATGEVATQLTATRRPIMVQAHGTAPFTARRHFDHTADKFTASKPEIDVRNQFILDAICPFRRGLIGAATRRIAGPIVRRGLADGDREAEAQIRAELGDSLERELDKLALALNRVPPLVRQTHEVVIAELKLPKEGVKPYRAATKDHLLFSIGKPDRRMPTLPVLSTEICAPVELWIGESKDAGKEERRKFLLENWRLIVPVLMTQLEVRSPELTKEIDEPLAKLLEEVRIHVTPGWHVVLFAPKLEIPVLASP